MELKGSKTEKNLMDAFAGESQARNKYTYFASVAKSEGYVQISKIFETTAANEKEHAELWFKHLGLVGNTVENLKAAAEGEHFEWTDMYKRMADEAEAEGFLEIARQMRGVAEIEARHEARYNALCKNIETGEVFVRSGKTRWECLNCGAVIISEKAPEQCPVCKHAKAYFALQPQGEF
ncbi:MAG: ferritin family protein [Kiritimatiellia bacterium]